MNQWYMHSLFAYSDRKVPSFYTFSSIDHMVMAEKYAIRNRGGYRASSAQLDLAR
jgi:hypothetical protein